MNRYARLQTQSHAAAAVATFAALEGRTARARRAASRSRRLARAAQRIADQRARRAARVAVPA